MLRSLADPERLRIIQCLRHGPLNVGEIADRLETTVVKVSHHLGVLRHADMVIDEKQGRFVVYRLNPAIYQQPHASELSAHLDLGCCRLEIPKPTD
jgi:ArsR family transcriptional regulator